MAGGSDIIQNIVLAGQDDVIAGFNAIGEAGSKAFQTIEDAASNISLGGFVGALAGITAAVAAVTAGFFEWAEASSNATIKNANFADELGTSTANMTTFLGALAEGGNQTNDLTASFRRFAVTVEAVWPVIQKATRNAADQIKEDYIKVGEAQVALQFSGQKAAETQTRDALAIRKSTLDVAEAKLNLRKIDDEAAISTVANATNMLSAQQNLANAEFALQHIGRPATAQEKQANAQANAELAVQQAILQIKELQDKQDREAQEQAVKRRQAVLAIAEAEEKLREAKRKSAEDAALAPLKQQKAELDLSKAQSEQQEHNFNDIEKLRTFVEHLATGASTAEDKVQLSSQNLLKGLIAYVGPAADTLTGFDKSLGEVGANAPKLYNVMQKVADIFHNTTDATLRAALATAIFGRGYSFTLVESLAQGGDALRKQQQHLKEVFDLTDDRAKKQEGTARQFRASFNTLATDIGLVSQQVQAILQPSFSAVFDALAASVEKNRTVFLEWATSLKDSVNPVITGLISSLTGINLSNALNLSPEQILKAAEWKATFDDIKVGLRNFVDGVGEAIGQLPSVFGVISSALEGITSTINGILGTNLSKTQTAIILLAATLTGPLIAAIAGVVSAFAVLAIAFAINPITLIGAGILVAVAALAVLSIAIYKNRDAINDWINTKVSGAFNWLSDAMEDVVTKIKRSIEDAKSALYDLVTFGTSGLEKIKADRATQRVTEDIQTRKEREARDAQLAGQPPGAQTPATAKPLDVGEQLKKALESLGTSVDIDQLRKSLGPLGTARNDANAEAARTQQEAAAAQQEAARVQQQAATAQSQKVQQEKAESDDQARRLNQSFPASGYPEATSEGYARPIGSGSGAAVINAPESVPVNPNNAPGAQEQIRAATTQTEAAQTQLQAANAQLQAAQKSATQAQQPFQSAAPPYGIEPATETPSGDYDPSNSGYAEGGTVGGKPGRDKNLAYLTRGEFVHNTDAVAHYGEGFMHAINNRQFPKFNLGGLVNWIPKFASGGYNAGTLARAPAYYGGGPAIIDSGGHSGPHAILNLHIDRQPVAQGLHIPDRETANSIRRFAVSDSKFSTGQSPSWSGAGRGRR